jgi:hypothetical protein
MPAPVPTWPFDTPSAVRGFADQDPGTLGERRAARPGGDDAGKFPDNARLLAAAQRADAREKPGRGCR